MDFDKDSDRAPSHVGGAFSCLRTEYRRVFFWKKRGWNTMCSLGVGPGCQCEHGSRSELGRSPTVGVGALTGRGGTV